MPLGAQIGLMLLFGVAGWHHARHVEKKYGASGWGLPSWVWGIITAFSLLLGAILLHFAEKPLKRQAALVPAGQAPAWAPGPVAAVPAMLATAPAAAATVAAGWHPDPSGRHQLRWWDGERWTSSVHDDGVTTTDA